MDPEKAFIEYPVVEEFPSSSSKPQALKAND